MSSSSSDEEFNIYAKYWKTDSVAIKNETFKVNTPIEHNIVHKLLKREYFTTTTRNGCSNQRKIFQKIPPRLRFCLMDIVPTAYIHSHVFMGFSQCGQFLLSFTYEHMTVREYTKFDLHFLSWVPGQQAMPVHRVTLFDDDPVDAKVSVSLAQWKHNSSVIVAYGIGESASERSYLSIIGVPQLGCQKCVAFRRKISDEDDPNGGKRCLEHNFVIHTKFYCASDSSMYEPVVQLAYSNQIVIYTDFIHLLEIDLVDPNHDMLSEDLKPQSDKDEIANSVETNPSTPASCVSSGFQSPKYQSIAVQNILADFSDLEMEPYMLSKPVQMPDVMGQELCIQASSISHSLTEEWEGPSPSIRTLVSPPLRSPRRRPAESISRFNESHRIIAEKTYEFVEEADTKCEKLSMFRKRRLADKKYEFSEENNENIVPFRVLRSNNKYYIGSGGLPRDRSRRGRSPESGVLRPRNPAADVHSEAEYRVTEMQDDGSLKTVAIHDNTSKTLSECTVNPQDPYLVHSGNSQCSKFFTRYFVESDDEITSILTDSEDDSMSGYHVALPLIAHGAGYSALQPLSAAAYERVRSSTEPATLTLRAQQRSLDMELLCNEVCGRLCCVYGKKFIYCFDWGCHVIDVCQPSGCLSGLCAMWLWASDNNVKTSGCEACKDKVAGCLLHRRQFAAELCAMWLWASDNNVKTSGCEACKDKVAGCLLHRRQFAAECLFTWDLVTGLYRTETVSMTEDSSNDNDRVSGADRARELAKRLGPICMPPGNEHRLLTTLTGSSSLKKLTDVDHCIEITKHHPDVSDSESSSHEGYDSD